MTWRLQYAEELKKEISYHRNKTIDYLRLMTLYKNKEVQKEMDIITNPFNPEKIPELRYEYKIGDVLMNRWNFNIARIINISGDWYYFDREGMCLLTMTHTQVHKNSVEPEHCMRKVDIDLPIVTFSMSVEK